MVYLIIYLLCGSQMIYAAIAALNERNGSSKRAIAKYIEQAYSGLPPSHSALLTHNLKRLKNTGHLVMVKKSYKLPRSDASPSAPPAPSLSGDPKGQGRGRGRPPKPKIAPGPIIEPNAQPVLVALGLVDDPNVQPVEAKRGPGRPRKTGPVGQDGGPTKRGRGRPPGPRVGVKPRLMKKTPKPKSVTSVLGSNGLKRGRGRPPKSQLKTMVIPFAPNNVPAVAPVVNVPRPRGRPKKDAAAPVLPVYAADGVVGKFPGGPPNVGKARKPKKTTGRPVGRPKKVIPVLLYFIASVIPSSIMVLGWAWFGVSILFFFLIEKKKFLVRKEKLSILNSELFYLIVLCSWRNWKGYKQFLLIEDHDIAHRRNLLQKILLSHVFKAWVE